MTTKKKAFLIGVLTLALLVGMPQAAHALVNTSSPNILTEEFNTGEIKKPDLNEPWDYWYKTLISADALGFYKQENLQNNIQCNNSVCLTVEEDPLEDDVHFARLALNPSEYPDNVNISQISEQRDAFSYEAPHRWLPTVGHPVVMTNRLRFSPNFHPNGSGGAVGTTLMQLWNAPDDYQDPNADISRDNSGFFTHTENLFTMGFLWTDEHVLSGGLRGFKAIVSDHANGAPTYLVNLSGVDINQWFTTKIVWAVNALGVQTVTFYVNDVQVGFTPLAIPMPALEFLTIHDNARPQIGPTGLYYQHPNPTAPQYVDLDSIDIRQE